MRTPRHERALDLLLQVLPAIHPVVQQIRTYDRNLADQLRRAATSVALNLAEADGSDPGTRRARVHSALGSLSETRTALKVAVAWRYVDATLVDRLDVTLDRVAAMTWRRLHGRA